MAARAAKPHVIFIHLDLGIGGAESLVLNLAKATLPDVGSGNKPDSSDHDHDEPSSSSSSSSGSISIYTTHCSPTHCYDEVKPPHGALYPNVHVRGSWIPRNFTILGGTALCSALRMLYLTYRASRENPDANVFVIDVLPTGVPYLVEYCNVKAGVLFYCHFPDKLLTRDTINGETDNGNDVSRRSTGMVHYVKNLKRVYRWAMDAAEEWSMSYSDLIVVNSKFTRGVAETVFPSLFLPRSSTNSDIDNNDIQRQDERVKVLYPSIESSLSKQRKIRRSSSQMQDQDKSKSDNKPADATISGPIVSLNRFERKKNVALLLHAYDLLLDRATKENDTGALSNLPPLIIAGGYDPLNVENVEHLSELRNLADEILDRYNLPRSTVSSPSKSSAEADDDILERTKGASIAFHPSISNAKRTKLLSSASVWCYTPHREHFGIVPLEAMDAGVPVVAMRSGGPMESIVDGVTGYLVDYSPEMENNMRENPTVQGFANAIEKLLKNPTRAKVMGQRGRERVDEAFGMETFRKQWWELLAEAQERGVERYRKRCNSYPSLGWSVIRMVGEMFWVVLSALVFTWALRKSGLW